MAFPGQLMTQYLAQLDKSRPHVNECKKTEPLAPFFLISLLVIWLVCDFVA